MIGLPSLALGGLAAAAVALWSQIRAAASYLSSFAVVTLTTDQSLADPLHIYIRTHFKLVPSGQLRYIGLYVNLIGRKNTTIVPYKVTPSTAIWRQGFRFLVVTHGGDYIKLVTLRGMFNFESVISAALDSMETRLEQSRSAYSRYHVIRVLGREKGNFGVGGNGRENPTENTLVAKSHHDSVDLSIDTSFKYPKSMFADNKEADPMEGLFYEESVLRHIKQAKQWLGMGAWYLERGIPWRRGWLLYGEAGTGKSSLAKATAQTLKLPIYHFYLATLSDQEFLREWEGMVTPCVALFEDFDAVFRLRESLTEHKQLTFDCVLNAISGVSSVNGVFLIVSTNHLENIDPAMGVECGKDGISTRPGRIDSVIYIGKMQAENRRRLATKILKDWPEEIESAVEKGDDMTPIQFQEYCLQRSFSRLTPTLLKEAA